MQRVLNTDTMSQLVDAYPVVAHAPQRQDDLSFFTGLWAILPLALGGWALIVFAALRILG